MYEYSDPTRESDEHALPDVEVFEVDYDLNGGALSEYDRHKRPGSEVIGWYWWACFPGCIPDSDPYGPFESEAEAIADARNEL
jgi:hypothetical protein